MKGVLVAMTPPAKQAIEKLISDLCALSRFCVGPIILLRRCHYLCTVGFPESLLSVQKERGTVEKATLFLGGGGVDLYVVQSGF